MSTIRPTLDFLEHAPKRNPLELLFPPLGVKPDTPIELLLAVSLPGNAKYYQRIELNSPVIRYDSVGFVKLHDTIYAETIADLTPEERRNFLSAIRVQSQVRILKASRAWTDNHSVTSLPFASQISAHHSGPSKITLKLPAGMLIAIPGITHREA